MALKVRFRFDGRCSAHRRYKPERDGRPQDKDCPGCDALWVIHLCSGIARRKAQSGEGIVVSHSEVQSQFSDSPAVEEESPDVTREEQEGRTESTETTSIGP